MNDPNQQYQQPEIRTSPYSSPMYSQGTSMLILTEPIEDLEKLELHFRGKALDADGNIISIGRPLMNEEGINNIMGMIKSITSKITFLSQLDRKEISPAFLSFSDALVKDLMINSSRYNLDKSDRDKVLAMCQYPAYFGMKRASTEDGELSDKRFWRGSVQEISTKVDGGNNKKGLLATLAGWKK